MTYLIVFGIYVASIAIHIKLSLIYNRIWQARKVILWRARAPKDNTKENIYENEEILLHLKFTTEKQMMRLIPLGNGIPQIIQQY